MFETLYKTDSPKDFATGEYYQVRIDFAIHPDTRERVFYVRELHGYLDKQKNEMVHFVPTLTSAKALRPSKRRRKGTTSN